MTANARKIELIEYLYDELDGTLKQVQSTVNTVITRYQVEAGDIGVDERNGLTFLTVYAEHGTASVRLSKYAQIMSVEYSEKAGCKEIRQAKRREAEIKANKLTDDREVEQVIVDEFQGVCKDKSCNHALVVMMDIIDECIGDSECTTLYCDLFKRLDWMYDNGLIILDSLTGRSFSIAC